MLRRWRIKRLYRRGQTQAALLMLRPGDAIKVSDTTMLVAASTDVGSTDG